MKKIKFLFIAIFILNSAFLLNANAEGTYWSNVKNGPTTIEQAKKQFGTRQLDLIEGVWFEEGLGTISIIKRNNQFQLYLIEANDAKNSIFNGTWEGTLIESGIRSFNFFNKVWYSNSKGQIVKYGTQGGVIKLNSSNTQFTKIYDQLSDAGVNMNSISRKVWPIGSSRLKDPLAPPPGGYVFEKFDNFDDIIKRKKDQKNPLQYWWVVVLVGLVAFFIYTQTAKKIPKKKSKKITSALKKNKKTKSNSFLLKFYRGEETLGISYWIYYSIISGILIFLITVMERAKVNDSFVGLYSLLALSYYIFAAIGTWRSANNYTKMKIAAKQTYGWATVTKVLIVLAMIRGVVAFVKAF